MITVGLNELQINVHDREATPGHLLYQRRWAVRVVFIPWCGLRIVYVRFVDVQTKERPGWRAADPEGMKPVRTAHSAL